MKRSVAVLFISAGAMAGLAGCTAGDASSPEAVVKEYIAALNSGDYEKALSMVADPGEVTAKNITNFTAFEYQEPLLRGEPLSPSAESGTLGIDLDGTPTPVAVEKHDGQWKLTRPVALTAVDYTERFAAFDELKEIGTISFTSEDGEPITKPTGFSMLPSDEESTQEITVNLDGNLVPDQKLTVAASALGDGWPAAELELGDLPAKAAAVIEDLRYIDYHYDESAGAYLTQEGPVSAGSCRVSEDTRLHGAFGLECAVSYPDQDFDGNPFLRRDASERTVSTKSKYDNLREFSVRSFGGCAYGAGVQIPSTSEDEFITIGIQSGEASVLWTDDLDVFAPAYNGGVRLSESAALEECSGWAPDRAGTVIQGIAPQSSDDAGTTVSRKL